MLMDTAAFLDRPSPAPPAPPDPKSWPLFQDARDYQILFLGGFLVLGIGTRDWSLRPLGILTAIVTCLLSQWCLERLLPKAPAPDAAALEAPSLWAHLRHPIISPSFNFRSPLITSLGLSLLLRVDHWQTMALAAFLAIASKFIFQFHEKHFFNPANFGIAAVLFLTQDAWVSPGQWGEEGWYGLLFLGAGGLVLQKVGRWDTTFAFLGSYTLLEALRNAWLGWTWDVFAHRLMSGSLLLFALFMITDPRAIPNARGGRVCWAVAIACLTFFLRNHYFISTAMFWALLALSPLSILCDWLWKAPTFQWRPAPPPATDLALLVKSR